MKDLPLQNLMTSMFEMQRQLRMRLPRKCAPDPRQWGRLSTLKFVDHTGGATVGEIAVYLQISAPSATSLVKTLETMRLARRITDRADKRIVRVVTTAKGKALLRRHGRMVRQAFSEMLSVLDERDLEQFQRIIQKIAAGGDIAAGNAN